MTAPARTGSLSELRACLWLNEQGYEVFRNIHPTGPVDVVAIGPDGEAILLDVKTANHPTGRPRLTEKQRKLGVRPLYVRKEGKFEIGEADLPKDNCEECGAEFVKNTRNGQRFCSRRCSAKAWNAAHPEYQKEYQRDYRATH